MNDFFLAANRSIKVPVLENVVEVRQIQMKNFDIWLTHAEPLKEFLKNKDHSDEILTKLFATHAIQVVLTMACVTDLDKESLLKVAKNEQEFKNLLKAVLDVNQVYFKPDKQQRRAKVTQTDSTWFDSFQYLISAGHRHDDIMNMTYGAFDRYLKAAQKNQKNNLKLSRFAQYGKDKEFTKFVDG